jgi:hypothetical protein
LISRELVKRMKKGRRKVKNRFRKKPMLRKKAGFFTRSLAYLGDFAIGHMAHSYLLSFPAMARVELSIQKSFDSLFLGVVNNQMAALLTTLGMVFIITQIQRFYATLILGVSFIEKMAGLYSLETWWWARIGGAARVVIETFTLPFVIAELPSLFGKDPLKDRLTQTPLRAQYNSATSFFKMVFIPGLLIIGVSAPLLQNLTLIDGFKLSFKKVKEQKLKGGEDFNQFRTYSSSRFHLKSFSALANQRFLLIPDVEILRNIRKRKIRPYFTIYDRKNGKVGSFKVTRHLAFLNIIYEAQKGNPLFSRFYPELALVVKEDRKSFEKRIYKKEYVNRLLMEPEAVKQLELLVQSSLELGLPNLISHILKEGPFLRGHVQLRQILLSFAYPGVELEIDMIRLGKVNFLRFQQSLGSLLPDELQQREILIPLGTHNALIFEYAWNKDKASVASRNAFRQTFLSTTEWYFDYKNFEPYPELEAEMTSLNLLDTLTKSKISQKEKELFEEFLYRKYYELARLAFKEKREGLKKFLLENLERVRMVLDIREEKEIKVFSKVIINQMDELYNSIKSGDQSYFNI